MAQHLGLAVYIICNMKCQIYSFFGSHAGRFRGGLPLSTMISSDYQTMMPDPAKSGNRFVCLLVSLLASPNHARPLAADEALVTVSNEAIASWHFEVSLCFCFQTDCS